MASVELVSDVQSPALATAGILFGVLPLVTMVVHHGRQCADVAGLPVRMQPMLTPTVGQASADTTLVSN